MSWFTGSTKRSTSLGREPKQAAGHAPATSQPGTCPACGRAVTHAAVPFGGKELSGVRCKGCGRSFCLICYNPTQRLLTCEQCGHGEFSFLVEGA